MTALPPPSGRRALVLLTTGLIACTGLVAQPNLATAAPLPAVAAAERAERGPQATLADRVLPFAGTGVGVVAADRVGVDQAGNAYLPGQTAGTIQRVSPTGTITTISIPGGRTPAKLTASADGRVWAVVAVPVVVQLRQTWRQVLFVAEPGATEMQRVLDLGDYPDRNMQIHRLEAYRQGVAISANDRIVYADPKAGSVTPLAGTGQAGFAGDDGPAVDALLNQPDGMAVDPAGNLVVADKGNNRVRVIDTKGIIRTVAGTGTAAYSGDGEAALDACFNAPHDVGVDSAGNIYVADTENHRIRVVDNYRTVTTVIGSGVNDPFVAGAPAPQTNLHNPDLVDVTGNGALVIESSSVREKLDRGLFVSQPLARLALQPVPLPRRITEARTSGYLAPRDGGSARTPASFELPTASFTPNAKGTAFVTGFHTYADEKKGAPFTITAQSATYTVTNPIEFSNLLLLEDVTISHTVKGVEYSAKLPNVSLAYETGYGTSYVATTPKSPMPWGDLVVPELRDVTGRPDPDNDRLAGAWVMKAGISLEPQYSPR